MTRHTCAVNRDFSGLYALFRAPFSFQLTWEARRRVVPETGLELISQLVFKLSKRCVCRLGDASRALKSGDDEVHWIQSPLRIQAPANSVAGLAVKTLLKSMSLYPIQQAQKALAAILSEESLDQRLRHAHAELSVAKIHIDDSGISDLLEVSAKYFGLSPEAPRCDQATALRQLLETIFEEAGKGSFR